MSSYVNYQIKQTVKNMNLQMLTIFLHCKCRRINIFFKPFNIYIHIYIHTLQTCYLITFDCLQSHNTIGRLFLRLKIGEGNRVRFWEDVWVGDKSFSVLFPNLFRLSSKHNAPISALYTYNNGNVVSRNFHFWKES